MTSGDVEVHMSRLERLGAESDPSPDELLASLAMLVTAMNTEMAQPDTSLRGEALAQSLPVGDVVEKLEERIKRLRESLTKIVEKLGKGTSFSISVGFPGGLNVTINFPPFLG